MRSKGDKPCKLKMELAFLCSLITKSVIFVCPWNNVSQVPSDVLFWYSSLKFAQEPHKTFLSDNNGTRQFIGITAIAINSNKKFPLSNFIEYSSS